MDYSRLKEIRKRESKATPGPWIDAKGCGPSIYQSPDGVSTTMMVAEVRGWGHLTGKGAGGLGLSEDEAYDVMMANAAFIANAREDIKYLLDEIDQAHFRPFSLPGFDSVR